MMQLLRSILGLKAAEPARSPRWPSVRRIFLAAHPTCAACGSREKLEVHHVRPYHLHPEAELDFDNLITLCEPDHLTFGHLKNWQSFNPAVREDAASYLAKVLARPKGSAA